jgi:hypothetical protein
VGLGLRAEAMKIQRRQFLHLAAGVAALTALFPIVPAGSQSARTIKIIVPLDSRSSRPIAAAAASSARVPRRQTPAAKASAKLLIHLTRCVSPPWRLDLDVGARRGYRTRGCGYFLADFFALRVFLPPAVDPPHHSIHCFPQRTAGREPRCVRLKRGCITV